MELHVSPKRDIRTRIEQIHSSTREERIRRRAPSREFFRSQCGQHAIFGTFNAFVATSVTLDHHFDRRKQPNDRRFLHLRLYERGCFGIMFAEYEGRYKMVRSHVMPRTIIGMSPSMPSVLLYSSRLGLRKDQHKESE